MTEHYLICVRFDPNHTFEREGLIAKRLKRCTTSNVSNPLQYSIYVCIIQYKTTMNRFSFLTKIYIERHPGRKRICFALGNISSEPKLISRELPESNLSARFSATIHFHPHLELLRLILLACLICQSMVLVKKFGQLDCEKIGQEETGNLRHGA